MRRKQQKSAVATALSVFGCRLLAGERCEQA
jgi:hypothetical protein